MTFVENYKLNLNKTRLVSKIVAFLIAVVFFVEIISNVEELIFSEYKWTQDYYKLLKTLSFQSIASIIFGVRFVLLCIDKPKSILLSQFIWFIGWLSLCGFFVIVVEKSDIHIHHQISISKTFFILIPYFHFLFSPIKQILTFVATFIYRKS